MIRILFQNGPDAPEIELPAIFESESEAKKHLDSLAETYGTVPSACAWIQGKPKPRALRRELREAERKAEEAAAAAEAAKLTAAAAAEAEVVAVASAQAADDIDDGLVVARRR